MASVEVCVQKTRGSRRAGVLASPESTLKRSSMLTLSPRKE